MKISKNTLLLALLTVLANSACATYNTSINETSTTTSSGNSSSTNASTVSANQNISKDQQIVTNSIQEKLIKDRVQREKETTQRKVVRQHLNEGQFRTSKDEIYKKKRN